MTCSTSAVAVCCAKASRVSVKEPCVLDRDDRLIGDGRDQRDLLLGERLDARAAECDDADQRILADQRYPQHCPLKAELDRFGPGVFEVGRRVLDMHRTPFERRPAGQGAAAQRDRIARLEVPVFCRNPECGHHAKAVLQLEDKPEVGLADARRLFQHRIEHGCEVAGRGIDHLQYLGGRGLLLKRLARLGQEPRVLHRDNRLRGEVLEQRDLLVGERPHLAPSRGDLAEEPFVPAQRHAQQSADSF